MEVIKSGLEAIRGGEGCPCICSRGSGGFLGQDTEALDGGGCSCGCTCSYVDTFDNNIANQTSAYIQS
jgi:hypothetical protein